MALMSPGERLFKICNSAIITVFLIITLYPLWFVICASFSDVHKLLSATFVFWPQGFTLEGYDLIFSARLIWTGYRNTILYMVAGTALNIIMVMISAYPLSRRNLPGRVWMTKLIVLTMYVGGGMIPSYLVVTNLGIRDTFLAMLLPNAVSSFMIIIAISFIRSTIPESILDAAMIDGANGIKTFCHVVFPLSAPLLGILAVSFALGYWNSYAQALIYLSNKELFPLQLVLRQILIKANSDVAKQIMGDSARTYVDYVKLTRRNELIKYTSMVVSSLPLLVIYPFLRKYFTRGLIIGSIKE